jgi:hypothetical protein
MNTNWAKVLLFTLLGFALGWIMSCLLCSPCMGRGECGGKAACHAEASCGHGDGKRACCKGDTAESEAHHGHDHHEHADSTHAH